MTPEEYADKYLKLTWQYDKTTFQASIRKYLAMDPEICDAGKIKGSKTAQGWILKALKSDPDVTMTKSEIQIKSLKKSVSMDGFEKTFHGKASPGQIADTLWLATHLKFITAGPKDPTVEGREAARPQDFADWYLGMDCSGFANNFLGFNSGQHLIKSLDQKHETRRVTIDSIVAGDVMVSRNVAKDAYHHIAIVVQAKKKGDGMVLSTVESYGFKMAGVGKHDRNLVMSSPGVFVDPNPKNRTSEIYIQPPPAKRAPSL
jgi:hypothetical protein